METLEKQIGMRLRARREDLNLTQGEVASKMGVAVTTVQRLENAETQPRIDTLLAYCNAVGVKLDDIAGETNEPAPVRQPSNGEILNVVKNALKVAENPLIQGLLALSSDRQELVKNFIIELKREQEASQNLKKPSNGCKRL